jgi:hypothetical protein
MSTLIKQIVNLDKDQRIRTVALLAWGLVVDNFRPTATT